MKRIFTFTLYLLCLTASHTLFSSLAQPQRVSTSRSSLSLSRIIAYAFFSGTLNHLKEKLKSNNYIKNKTRETLTKTLSKTLFFENLFPLAARFLLLGDESKQTLLLSRLVEEINKSIHLVPFIKARETPDKAFLAIGLAHQIILKTLKILIKKILLKYFSGPKEFIKYYLIKKVVNSFVLYLLDETIFYFTARQYQRLPSSLAKTVNPITYWEYILKKYYVEDEKFEDFKKLQNAISTGSHTAKALHILWKILKQ